jgi:hypothetical protein
MVDQWLDNGPRLLARLISRNVPANPFLPRAIRNRRAILSAMRSDAHVSAAWLILFIAMATRDARSSFQDLAIAAA